MKKFNLGTELTKNQQRKILGGWVRCNDGTYLYYMACSNGPAYCSFHGGLSGCG